MYSNSVNVSEKLLCNKKNINLLLCQSESGIKKYRLNFNILNHKSNINKFINNNLFELICKLNTDIIDSYEIYDKNTNSCKIFILFKKFGADLGIKQKYSYFESQIIQNNNNYVIKTTVLKCPSTLIPYPNKNYECLDYNSSFININIINDHSCMIDYIFDTFNTSIELPVYMENMFGMLTKKLFLRLKQFIENI